MNKFFGRKNPQYPFSSRIPILIVIILHRKKIYKPCNKCYRGTNEAKINYIYFITPLYAYIILCNYVV